MAKKKNIFDGLINTDKSKKTKKAYTGAQLNSVDDDYLNEWTPKLRNPNAGVSGAQVQPMTQPIDTTQGTKGRTPGDASKYFKSNDSKPKIPGMGYQGPSFDMSMIIGGGLGFLNALLPNQDRPQNFLPEAVYNQWAQGTGSQAIMKAGGEIPKKGKKQGPPAGWKQGDPLPDWEQMKLNGIMQGKHYPQNTEQPYEPAPSIYKTKAGLVGASYVPVIGPAARAASITGDLYTAGRYAMDGQWDMAGEDLFQMGLGILPGTRAAGKPGRSLNRLAKSARGASDFKTVADLSPEQQNTVPIFDAGGDITGGPGLTFNNSKSNAPTQLGDVDLMDMVNLSLIKGSTKLKRDEMQNLRMRADQNFGAGAANQLLTDLDIFNKDSNNAQFKGEDRINRYYSSTSQNPLIQNIRTKLKSYGTSPAQVLRDSPNVEVQKEQIQQNMYSNRQLQNSVANQLLTDQRLATTMKAGGTLQANSGLHIEDGKYTQLSDDMIQINGDTHADGGTMINYGGNTVEAEKGESISFDEQNNATIWGNMSLPGTKTKFKNVAKEIGNKQNKYEFLKMRGSELVNGSNPANRFEKLTFNAGQVMMEGGEMASEDLNNKKNQLASLQRAMLDTAKELNLDPISLSEGRKKKAKKSTFMKAEAGDYFDPNDPNVVMDPGDPKSTMADRNNNPGNIKFGKFAKKYGGVKGPAASDGGNFAIFPDRQSGFTAMKSLLKSDGYKNLTVDAAISRWTNNKPYKYNFANSNKTKVGELNDTDLTNLMTTMSRGEGTKYGTSPGTSQLPTRAGVIAASTPPPPQAGPEPTFDAFGRPVVSLSPEEQADKPRTYVPPNFGEIPIPQRPLIPSNAQRLSGTQLIGEMYGLATNSQDPVYAAEYQPLLKNPYQVSFQDRINENQSIFNALQQRLSSNPEALASMAGQLYRANDAVEAEEFRVNQGISNQVNNENINTLNQAQLTNIGIRDQQFVRQAQAKSNTKAQNQAIFNSISSKYLQNSLENKRLQAYENLYDYRFTPDDNGNLRAKYYGPDAVFNGVAGQQQSRDDLRTISRYDGNGNLKSTTIQDDSELRDKGRRLDNQKKAAELPVIGGRKLFGRLFGK